MHCCCHRAIEALGVVLAAGVVWVGCVEQEPDRPSEKDLEVIKRNILKQPPPMKYAVNADLEGKVKYLGLDVSPAVVRAGQSVKLTHYWQVTRPVPGWKIFVHVNDPSKKRFINADHKPVGGRYAASYWKAGEIIRDEHSVNVPADWPADKLEVYTGLWKGRLRMKPTGPQDKENRILAASIPVSGGARHRHDKPRPKRLLARKADKAIVIDGKLNEPVWKATPSTGLFVNTLTGQAGAVKTEAKVAWDAKYLYVAFENQDSDVWGEFSKRDDKLWTEEAVEIFIDANNDGKDYIELQVSPQGTIFDSYLPSYRRNQNDWNSGMRAKVTVEGTLNKRGDTDKSWVVEIAIPWKDVKGRGSYALSVPPAVGTAWRVNFFRLDKPKTGPQVAVAWSAPLVGDFHKLDRFGEVVFADAKGRIAVGAASGRAAEVAGSGKRPVLKMAQPAQRNLRALRAKGARVSAAKP